MAQLKRARNRNSGADITRNLARLFAALFCAAAFRAALRCSLHALRSRWFLRRYAVHAPVSCSRSWSIVLLYAAICGFTELFVVLPYGFVVLFSRSCSLLCLSRPLRGRCFTQRFRLQLLAAVRRAGSRSCSLFVPSRASAGAAYAAVFAVLLHAVVLLCFSIFTQLSSYCFSQRFRRAAPRSSSCCFHAVVHRAIPCSRSLIDTRSCSASRSLFVVLRLAETWFG